MTVPAPSVLVPRALRRPLMVVAALAVVVFAVLAVRYAGTSGPGSFDAHIQALLVPIGFAHYRITHFTADLGSPVAVITFALVLAALCYRLDRRRLAVLAIVGPGITGVLTTGLKPVLARTIGDGFAYPSGHTGGATSLGLVAAILIVGHIATGRSARLALVAASGVLCGGVVGAAMVGLGAHYPTDVVGGFCTAVAVVCGAALVLDRIAERRSPSGENP
jgi:membrane-associated phospholipid phosphatase